MSNKTDLQALNANYEALIEGLRGKAVGGGTGGGVGTCTVTVVDAMAYDTYVWYESVENGAIVRKELYPLEMGVDYPLTVVKGSRMIVNMNNAYALPEVTGQVSYETTTHPKRAELNVRALVVALGVDGDGRCEIW